MTDVRIISIATHRAVTMDWLLTPLGTLDETEELATAVKVALGTNALAHPSDQLPGTADDMDRGGWWGDEDAAEIWDGWPIGCRNWILRRSAIEDGLSRLGSLLARIETYTFEALRPFIDRGICTRIDVQANRTGINQVVVNVVIYRGPLPSIALQFQSLWDEITAP